MSKKTIYIIVGLLLLVAATGTFLKLYSDDLHRTLTAQGVDLLSEKLQTEVNADRVNINIWKGELAFYGITMNDQQDSLLLHIDTLETHLDLTQLLHKQLVVKRVKLHGATAKLFKERKDTVANFQFIADAFKKKNDVKAPKKNKGALELDLKQLDISRLRVKWDICNLLRKNTGKPNHGAFDANHLDVEIDLQASLQSKGKKGLKAQVKHLRLHDYGSNLFIKHLEANVNHGSKGTKIEGLHIELNQTVLDMQPITMYIGTSSIDSQTGKKKPNLRFDPFDIEADVWLPDIAQPFAPVLSNFTTKLRLRVTAGGNIDRFTFDHVVVNTPDDRLRITTQGDLCQVTNKTGMQLHFTDIKLQANRHVKDEIISHFAKKMKMKMMQQIQAVGNITFNGTLEVRYKKELIAGTLFTHMGNVTTQFTIDDQTHFMHGTLKTDSLNLGELMNMKDLGGLRGNASFDFDIASKRKATDPRIIHGHLPHGNLIADIYHIHFKRLKFNEASVAIKSDGSTALGTILLPEKHFDLQTMFEYTQTDEGHKLKVKPSVKKHKSDAKASFEAAEQWNERTSKKGKFAQNYNKDILTKE